MSLPIPNQGSSLSGSGESPCPDQAGALAPAEPLSDLLRYTRLVKPFPIRRLSDVLYQVIAGGNSINATLIDVQIAQPTDPDSWCETLEALLLALWSLSRGCEEAAVHLSRMVDEADVQAERGEAAVRAIIAGLRAG